MTTTARLWSSVPELESLDPSELFQLDEVSERLTLRRGDTLMREGEPSTDLYFVASGRLAVLKAGHAHPIAEVGQGQPVGEIGFFAGIERTATVVALRDTTVLRLSQERFRAVSRTAPHIYEAIVISLARRLARTSSRVDGRHVSVRTVAIVPAGQGVLHPLLVNALRDRITSRAHTVFLSAEQLLERFPDRTVDDDVCTAWLNELESQVQTIFYLADSHLSEWTQKCVRQADAVLLVGEAASSPELNEVERYAFARHAPSARRLVLVHPSHRDAVSGTARWLDGRDVLMHHHVTAAPEDVQRLERFVQGRATGFVAGGGGALGCAHLGVYRAFREAGHQFDVLGGTSVGAAMMAGLASGGSADRVDEGTDNIFVKSRAFRRPTLPWYGLLDHTVFDGALHAEYGDVRIEDLWTPFYAVASDVGAGATAVLRRGPLWEAVRASSAIPGVLPPFFTKDGAMLVDGGLMDNVPLGSMKALKQGPNIVVSLSGPRRTFRVAYEDIPGLRGVVRVLLNPFARRRLPAIPNIAQVITSSLLSGRGQDVPMDAEDSPLRPTAPAGVRFSSWDRHSEIYQAGHEYAVTWLRDHDHVPGFDSSEPR